KRARRFRHSGDPRGGLNMATGLDIHEQRFWPFDVLPPDQQTDQHKREIAFLEAAHREGFRPWMNRVGDFGATAGERGGLIVVRGRKCREVILGTSQAKRFSAFVTDFDSAAKALLSWLRGAEPAEVLAQVEGHLEKTPKGSRGYTLYEEEP